MNQHPNDLTAKPAVLIVEDEDNLRRVLELHFRSLGYPVLLASRAEEAFPLLDRAGLILSDLRLPGKDGIALLETVRAQNPHPPVILMTAYGTVETAVEAMKLGAFDFVTKPFSLEHVAAVAARALEMQALRDENRQLREQAAAKFQIEGLIGRSPSMQEIFATVLRVGPTRATVLLAGESGTGKDRIARAIHHHSPRRDRPFVKINCSSLPENLMESELFGFEKGAFTGAVAAKPGKFEQADTGTVFLDEIGDVPLPVQVKLLRVLQERELERLGSNHTRRIDVRVIAATNADLRRALEEGTFREDLYYRLNVLPISIPPLRERREDIPFLAMSFVERLAREMNPGVGGITDAAIEKLLGYHWPGNVRELENVIERSLVLCRASKLDAGEIRLEDPIRKAGNGLASFLPDGMSLDAYEQQIIREALRRANGNKSMAARLLGVSRNALRYRLAQMGLASGPGEANPPD